MPIQFKISTHDTTGNIRMPSGMIQEISNIFYKYGAENSGPSSDYYTYGFPSFFTKAMEAKAATLPTPNPKEE